MRTNEIKEKANELAGVEEWFFDGISDEELEKYTVEEIIEQWNNSCSDES